MKLIYIVSLVLTIQNFDFDQESLTKGLSEFAVEAESLFKDFDPTKLQSLMTSGSTEDKMAIVKKLIPLFTKYILPKIAILKDAWEEMQEKYKNTTQTRLEIKAMIKDNCKQCYYSIFQDNHFTAVKQEFDGQNSFKFSDGRKQFKLAYKGFLTKFSPTFLNINFNLQSLLNQMVKEIESIEPVDNIVTIEDFEQAKTLSELYNVLEHKHSPPAEEETKSAIPSSNKWINLLNVYLKEMDTNYLLFNIEDYFRIVDSVVDKIKNLVIVNWDQRVFKLATQVVQSLVEDEPGMVSVQKIKMLRSGASYLNSDIVLKMVDDLVAADKDKNQMVDQKEAINQLKSWVKWGLNQVLAAWDYIFQFNTSVDSIVTLTDEMLFGTLQSVFDGKFDVNQLMDQIQNADIEDLLKADL